MNGHCHTMSGVCREGENTIDTVRIPIIFVPGVMGSRLHFTDINEYWDPDSTWRMLHWLRISVERMVNELNFTVPARVMTTASAITTREREHGWGSVYWESYGSFLRTLWGQNFAPAVCPVYVVGYDWRQSNRDSGNYLVNKIEEYCGDAEHVIILTHSMGGLVTRSALKQSSALAAKVLGVVHVVQPALGAVAIYRRFFTGAVAAMDGGRALSTILGNTGDKWGALLSVMPGPMEMLPIRSYRATGGANWLGYVEAGETHYWTGNVYDWYRSDTSPPGLPDSTEVRGVLARLRQRIDEAEYFQHQWLNGYKHPTKTWAIYSSGLATDMSILFDPPRPPAPRPVSLPGGVAPADSLPTTSGGPWINRGAQPQRPAHGDGSVPGTSGAGLFPGERHRAGIPLDDSTRQFRVAGVEHEPAFRDTTVQELVFRLIRYFISHRSSG